jgi:hypothetical protein
VLTLGDPLVTFGSIPALTPEFSLESTCPSECSITWPHKINVFADFLHMHAAGSRIFTNQFRNDSLVRTTNRIDFYSYGFQELVPVNYEIQPGIQITGCDVFIKISLGDRLNTHCTFDTRTRTSATNFGPGSLDEMCISHTAWKNHKNSWEE